MNFSICQICEMTSMLKPTFYCLFPSIRFRCLACSLDMNYGACQSLSEHNLSSDLDECKFDMKNKTSTTIHCFFSSLSHRNTCHFLFDLLPDFHLPVHPTHLISSLLLPLNLERGQSRSRGRKQHKHGLEVRFPSLTDPPKPIVEILTINIANFI